MKIKQPLLIAGAVTTLGIAGFGSAGLASAATSSKQDSLVDKIAAKFNLNKDDVQAVFDEDKSAHEAEMLADQSDRLQDAVDNGDITADQKTKIEAKLKEQQAARDKERSDLQSWADQNKIDLKYLMGGRHGGSDNYLQNAVDDGKITADQKKLIEAKQDELDKKRDDARDALEQWAKDNNIDMKYLRGFGGGHMHGGLGGPGRP